MPARKASAAKATARSGALANPQVGVAGAGLLFLVLAAVLLATTGDPNAGSPRVRASLTDIGAVENLPAGWREALAHEPPGEAPLVEDRLVFSQGPAVVRRPADEEAAQGDEAAQPAAQPTASAGLPHAPIAGLHVPGPGGAPLPVIAADGRTPAGAYARPFVSNGAPKVALVVAGLGRNAALTRRAIDTLPPEVTLAFSPYARDLQAWIDAARAAGHEVLLEAPMEPADYPSNDPGPYTLLVDNRPDETVKKLEWLLSRAVGYFGVTNELGARFVGSDPGMAAFTGAVARRGLAFVDDGIARRRAGPLRASADRVVDEPLSAEAIDRRLAALEQTAFTGGQALGAAGAYPLTIDQAARWARSLPARGLQLAPASALITKR